MEDPDAKNRGILFDVYELRIEKDPMLEEEKMIEDKLN